MDLAPEQITDLRTVESATEQGVLSMQNGPLK
jgi:hypothetical protein